MTTDVAAGAAVDVAAMTVQYLYGESYEVLLRGHRVLVDQPVDAGGADGAPTPTELFVASLAACMAFYAGRYLTRHGFSREGLAVEVEHEMATDRPARVAAVRVRLSVPHAVPADRWPALRAVTEHCTVHNTLTAPPAITLELM
jgi:uncharacterized OsmC-like protein